MQIFRTGYIVAVLLAVFTVVEYVFAVEVHDTTGRFIGLAISAVIKSALIVYYFMHIDRIWRTGEAH